MRRTQTNLSLMLTGLEIVKGHDELLRGKPEPVVLVAVYVLDGTRAVLIDRRLTTFAPTQPFPSTVVPRAFNPIYVEIEHQGEVRFALLAIALEEDGGGDIVTLYGALERPEQLKVWISASEDPAPLGLLELVHDDTWLYPTRAELMLDGLDTASRCRTDEWVGAVAWCFPPGFATSPSIVRPLDSVNEHSHAPLPSTVRLPFLSHDGHNEWSAIIAVRRWTA